LIVLFLAWACASSDSGKAFRLDVYKDRSRQKNYHDGCHLSSIAMCA
jgi:hypothetical protein